ncbi:bifunctional glutamate N-acetyltransferase/amino-acid acetyltransferase ArgJ [Rhizobium pusense]|uniref:bifunctional glutamate N-acetyltransferase/amino-acid acetyltransferase ArgJ n=1 Tax=Agrobacterium pusense TaxID=648995 RepID=UPI00244A9468|nr:bifunctional glutamate N-acetyltransferase/amino-acid acetyltransferase ArgJ [Agrobacterium pusense]MDH1270778.1 bifunctional glutamate N-acetyltransferase/amino-acid acetyltransferase ArgJ [Agrobacterium pusense]
MSKTLAKSPLAPETFPQMTAIEGIKLATGKAGIKYKDRTDVLLVTCDEGSAAAAVFTKSKCPGAPVDWSRTAIASKPVRAIVVNSGNANAFTGRKGLESAHLTAQIASQELNCDAMQVLLASTGVIGEPLDARKFEHAIPEMAQRLAPGDFESAARAIMTTDTFPKGAFRQVRIGDMHVSIAGIAKGSGMIAPDMATTLGFVFTDAPISQPVLQSLLSSYVEETFNAITVDSDTSTSDTLIAVATGRAAPSEECYIEEIDDLQIADFKAAFRDLLLDLACQVVKDGEGATKFVNVTVVGAETKEAARSVARAIANSPLVKTAIAGEDANWGRVVMAVGKSGENVDRDRLAIKFGDQIVALNGERAPSYDEQAVLAHMRQSGVLIEVDLGMGSARSTAYTCDLTKAYVEINGDYRS